MFNILFCDLMEALSSKSNRNPWKSLHIFSTINFSYPPSEKKAIKKGSITGILGLSWDGRLIRQYKRKWISGKKNPIKKSINFIFIRIQRQEVFLLLRFSSMASRQYEYCIMVYMRSWHFMLCWQRLSIIFELQQEI